MTNKLLNVDQPKSPDDTLKELDKRIKHFDELMSSLKDVDEKIKTLWHEIYENALIDRQNAYRLYSDVWNQMQGDESQHAIVGSTAAKYLERMGKANDQLIQLANLMATAEEEQNTIDPNQILSEISKGTSSGRSHAKNIDEPE